MKTLSKIGNVLTIIGGVLATLGLFQTSILATTAIQQCAGYSSACALVIVPYCVSKAFKSLGE